MNAKPQWGVKPRKKYRYVENSTGSDDFKTVNKVEDVTYATERQWHSYYKKREEDHENNQTAGVKADTQTGNPPAAK